jgi:deazaflavin-dependent oxidoreductase (nitroreductase family)
MPNSRLFGDEHVRQYEATAGQTGYEWNGTHILILRTTGRTSGEIRKVPLIFGRDAANYLVVASKGGAPDHPGWYKNLMARPDIEIQVKGQILNVHARTATADEKRRLWHVMTKEWADYDKYQNATSRDIPLVILSPR